MTLSSFSYGRCGHSLVSVRQFGSRVCCFSCRLTSGGLAFVRSALSILDFGSKGVYGHKGSGLETAIFRLSLVPSVVRLSSLVVSLCYDSSSWLCWDGGWKLQEP
ncbi:hypothetical protein YC2023_060314 [Brassica napus]